MIGLFHEHRWPLLALFLTAVFAVGALHSGWVFDGVGGGFHPGHVWAADHVSEMLVGDESWSGVTQRIGFPETVHLRLIAWVPLLLAAPFGWVLGVPASLWVMIVLGLFATGAVTMALIRRVVELDSISAASLALVYTFCPFSIGVLANGQLAKMQLWCLPLLLWFADKLLRDDESRTASAIGLFLSAVVMAFNAPSIGLVMPFALMVWVVLRTPSRQAWIWAVVALGVAALGMLPAWWMHTTSSSLTVGLLPAAPVPGLQSPAHLSPVATVSGLLGLNQHWDGTRSAINNVAVLGWPALVGGLLSVFAWSRSAVLGGSLLLVGVLFSLGPSVEYGGYVWRLPAEVLDRLGYPLQDSGMYYRFVQVASLGLAVSCATVVARWPTVSRRVAIAFGVLVFVDAYRVTDSLWPRPIRSIQHQDVYTAMASDPTPGAVLELPLAHIDTEGERRLVGQLIHRRPTTVLARNMVVQGQPRLERLSAAVRSANAQRELQQMGVRYVLLHRSRSNRALLQSLTQTLGRPQQDGGLAVWVVSQ